MSSMPYYILDRNNYILYNLKEKKLSNNIKYNAFLSLLQLSSQNVNFLFISIKFI